MKFFGIFAGLLVCFGIAYGQSAKTQYVTPGSVDCVSTGISYNLSTDASLSDLAAETQLRVDIYTDGKMVPNFNPSSGAVQINYADFGIVATTAYGPNQRPILYNVDQPFWAVPKSGTGRNYTWTVGCTIPAYADVHVVTNTTDDGHGDHGGDVVNPKDHVVNELSGLSADGSVALGNRLTYRVYLKDSKYAAIVPVSCKFYNPNDAKPSVPFVANSCPLPFPSDPDSYFGNMTRTSEQRFELNFKAFAFDTNPNSYLGVDCDLLLCIDTNKAECAKACWGSGGETTTAGSTTSAGETTTAGSTTSAAGSTTTAEGTTITTTEAPSTASEASTEASPTTTSTEAIPTEASSPSTEQPRFKRSNIEFSAAPTVLHVSFHVAPRILEAAAQNDDPKSTTINEKQVFKVNLPGTPTCMDQQPICTDPEFLKVLYGIIGALALLTMVLVLTLVWLLCVGRRHKVHSDESFIRPPY